MKLHPTITTLNARKDYPQRGAIKKSETMPAAKRVDIVSLKLVREGSFLYGNRRIRSADDAHQFLRSFLEDSDRERFVVVCLSAKNEPLTVTVASVGSLDATIVHPREVFKTAVHCGASGILVAHNHPSGHPQPSREDIEVTERLVKAGRLLSIDVLDHLIIGYNCYESLRSLGYMGVTE